MLAHLAVNGGGGCRQVGRSRQTTDRVRYLEKKSDEKKEKMHVLPVRMVPMLRCCAGTHFSDAVGRDGTLTAQLPSHRQENLSQHPPWA